MEALPTLCPSCGAFVRHDWTDTCGKCSAPLFEAESTSERATPESTLAGHQVHTPKHENEHPRAMRPKLLLGIAVAALVTLVIATTVIMGGQLEDRPSNTPTTLAESSPSTTVKPANDLGKQFVAGLASSKHLAVDLPKSGNNVTSAQLAKASWTHVADNICRCSADFPYSPVQRTGTFDGITEHTIYAATTTSPVGVGIVSLDIGANVSLADADFKAVATAFATQMQASSITSAHMGTVDGTRGVLVRASGDANVVESVFQHDHMLYVVFAVTVDTSDDPSPVYNKLIENFSTNSTV